MDFKSISKLWGGWGGEHILIRHIMAVIKTSTSLHQHWDIRNSKDRYHVLDHNVVLHPFPCCDMKKQGSPVIPSLQVSLALNLVFSVLQIKMTVTNTKLETQCDNRGKEQGAKLHPLTTLFLSRFPCFLCLAPPLQRLDSPVAPPRRCRSSVPAVTRLLTDVTQQQ